MSKPNTTPKRQNWQRFERVIAAIEYATHRGATVMWDEVINGRQFDVTIRFSNGPHQYLTLIECKNRRLPIPVEMVDAFVTKARDARANKSVIIARAGFQSGCLEVARRHGVDLFRLEERAGEPPGAEHVPLQPTLTVFDFVIHFAEARAPLAIPEDNNRLDYLLAKGVVRRGGSSESLQLTLDRAMAKVQVPAEFEKPQKLRIPLPGVTLEIPTLLEAAPVGAITCTLVKQRKKVVPPTAFDPHVVARMHSAFELIDCVNERPSTIVNALQLPIGFDNVFQPGRFYSSVLEQNYYCEKVENGLVTLVLVESYVHGNLIQASFRAKVATQIHYVEVVDFQEVLRLQKMYQRLVTKT